MSAIDAARLPDPERFRVRSSGVALIGERSGSGPPIVLLHGLSATRRYVTMGSRLLERRGYELIDYDARGHGESEPAPGPTAYEYGHLVADLDAVLDFLELERVVLAGSSMGGATALAYTLARPDRIAGLVQSTPAHVGVPYEDEAGLARWDALADGLEQNGVDGFLRAYTPQVQGRFAESIERLTRQRLERHRHPAAVAAALRVVPRSTAFDGLDALARVEVPTLIIGSRDEADPGHPFALAEEYARRIPDAELIVEDEGTPPIAWRGARISRAIGDFLAGRGIVPAQA